MKLTVTLEVPVECEVEYEVFSREAGSFAVLHITPLPCKEDFAGNFDLFSEQTKTVIDAIVAREMKQSEDFA